MPTPREIIEYILPFINAAGYYSARIQSGVGTHAAKDGATAFHHALSDADLTIQAYLEVPLLARFPDVSFFSEEQAQSLNAKYFAANADLEVLLDPIDGTRSYIDDRESYQIILTIHDRERIVGAVCHLPRRRVSFVAIRGGGAYQTSPEEIESRTPWKKLSIAGSRGPVLSFNAPELVRKLARNFEALDIVSSYEKDPGRYNFTDILEGNAIANVLCPVQAIDGGAIAFIAEEAGAVVSDLKGAPLGSFRGSEKRVLPGLVVAATAEIHTKIIEALSD